MTSPLRTQSIARRLLASNRPVICLVLGTIDTGKTTFILDLADQLLTLAAKPLALIDSDLGQSTIGPPSAIAWSILDRPGFSRTDLPISGLSFVGSLSPVGHLLPFTAGLKLCLQSALQTLGPGIVLIDTPGFATGPVATTLWWLVHQQLLPTHLILLQSRGELLPFTLGISHLASAIIPLKPSRLASPRTAAQRTLFRQAAFARYFRDALDYTLPLSSICIQNRDSQTRTLSNRLVSLRDANSTDLAIGYILRASPQTLTIRSPKIDRRRVRCVIIGSAVLESL